jgi:hypothetical protein
VVKRSQRGMSDREIVLGGVDGGRHSSYSTEPMSASEARDKARASTSATRQLRSDPGAVDRFGDAIEREPLRHWVMIHEAPNSVPER